MMREHPEAYSAKADVQLTVTTLRDQIAAPARTILLVLLAAAAVVFVIACSNVANLILARSVRREGELAVRAALGAGHGALRRTLLAESLVLCGAGAVLGVLLARPFVAAGRALRRALLRPRARRHRRCQRALGRRRPGDGRRRAARLRPASAVAARAGRPRPGERRRPDHAGHQPPPAAVRDDADCVLVRAARRRGHAPRRRSSRCRRRTPATTCGRCSAFDIPTSADAGIGDPKVLAFYQEATRRIGAAARRRRRRGRDASCRGATPAASVPAFQFTVEGYTPADGEENPRARFRVVAPRFFAVLGVPIARRPRLHRRGPRAAASPSSIVSQSVAQRLFPNGEAAEPAHVVDRSVLRQALPRRIVGIVADVDDENVVQQTGADDLSAGSADGRRAAACSCARPAIRTRSCRR